MHLNLTYSLGVIIDRRWHVWRMAYGDFHELCSVGKKSTQMHSESLCSHSLNLPVLLIYFHLGTCFRIAAVVRPLLDDLAGKGARRWSGWFLASFRFMFLSFSRSLLPRASFSKNSVQNNFAYTSSKAFHANTMS